MASPAALGFSPHGRQERQHHKSMCSRRQEVDVSGPGKGHTWNWHSDTRVPFNLFKQSQSLAGFKAMEK